MSNNQLTLHIEHRATTGTGGARALRQHGKIPAVLYGHGAEPQHVAFEARAFADIMQHGGRNVVFALLVDGKKADMALIRDLQRDPVSQRIVHVDLQRVSEHEHVHARLPVVTVGVARGVREFAGVMDVITHELEVEGPADHLPERIEIDVTELGIHGRVTAGEILLPAGFKMLTPRETTVITVEASKTARQVEEAQFVTSEQAEPEVIGAKKEGETA